MIVESTEIQRSSITKYSLLASHRNNFSFLITPTLVKYYLRYQYLINIYTKTLFTPKVRNYSSPCFFLHSFFLQHKQYNDSQSELIGLGNRDIFTGSHKYKLPKSETSS